ncbi:MAG: sugar phosphate nucleotidyltransferase [Prevotella sp.]|jgi:NDP-sugar pyrophosphorylase family protein
MKQAMIFAAGLGTRLKPLTDHMPKALVRVGGEPLLKHVVLKFRDAGFDRLVVNVHHFADQIIDYLKENDNFGMDIRISDEREELLETGGGLKKAAPLFDPTSPIFIHNVDILSNLDFNAFYDADKKIACPSGGASHEIAGVTLLVSWRKTKRYLLFNPQQRLVGWVNIETRQIKSCFAEIKALETEIQQGDVLDILRHHGLSVYAFSGIHTFSPQLFPLMQNYPEKFPIMDFYLQNADKVAMKGIVDNHLQLLDVGKQDTLEIAESFLLQYGC